MDDGSDKKKAKGTKKCVIKSELMFENYKDCFFNEKTIFKKQQRLKSYYHDVFTDEIYEVALSSNDKATMYQTRYKMYQTFDKATTFPQETPTVKVCENEMLSVKSKTDT